MRIRVHPITQPITASFKAPASKSYSIRALLAALCGGRSTLVNLSECEDVRVARRVVQQLGARIQRTEDDRCVVAAPKSAPQPCVDRINVGESGTVLRMMLPLLSLVAHRPVVVVGEGTLKKRPNTALLEALRRMGVDVQGRGKDQTVPIRIRPSVWRTHVVRIDGSMSSQFISGFLLAALFHQRPVTIHVTGRTMVSARYLDMTVAVLSKAGARIERPGNRVFKVWPSTPLKGLGVWRVPSDYGLSAFHIVWAAINPVRLRLTGWWPEGDPQADAAIVPILERFGVRGTRRPRSWCVGGPQELTGGRFNLKDAPDLVPPVAVLSLFSRTSVLITGAAHARLKESDRLVDLARALRSIGADVEVRRDGLKIAPLNHQPPPFRLLRAHHDHRLAMAWAVLGTRFGVVIDQAESVAKSYPGFFEDLRSAGVRLSKE